MRNAGLSLAALVCAAAVSLAGASGVGAAVKQDRDRRDNGSRGDLEQPKDQGRHARWRSNHVKLPPAPPEGNAPGTPPPLGTVRIWPAYDDTQGTYPKDFTLRALTPHAEVW